MHRAVLAAGETKSGATVHLVNAEYDAGEILCQKRVPIMPNDTSETLTKRIANVEGSPPIEALAVISKNLVRLEGN